MSPITKPPLVVILGSGFSESVGLSGVARLTELIRGFGSSFMVGSAYRPTFVGVGEALWRMATSYYDRPNFETMLHLVETIMSMPSGAEWLGLSDAQKPAFGAFTNVSPQWEPIFAQRQLMNDFGTAMLNVVAQKLIEEADHISSAKFDTIRELFDRLGSEYHLIIFNLNYDDIVERCLPSFADGYVSDEDPAFSPTALVDSNSQTELLHLHGSVRFGIRNNGSDVEIIRCSTATRATEIGRWSAMRATQAGEQIYIGPMVSGYRKSEKLAFAPYGYYYWRLTDALAKCPRVLTIGYGAGDTYLTRWLLEFKKLHGSNQRLAMVNKRDRGSAITGGVALCAALLNPRLGSADINGPAELDAITGNHLWGGREDVSIYLDGMPLESDVISALLDYLRTGTSRRHFVPTLQSWLNG